MAKDRNTMAKRQREADKKRKAEEKRGRRIRRKTEPKVASEPASGEPAQLSSGEVNVLLVFRKYLMTPGQMLCLSNTDIGSMKDALDNLIAAGMLVPEEFKGGYSLTRSGYEAMNELR